VLESRKQAFYKVDELMDTLIEEEWIEEEINDKELKLMKEAKHL